MEILKLFYLHIAPFHDPANAFLHVLQGSLKMCWFVDKTLGKAGAHFGEACMSTLFSLCRRLTKDVKQGEVICHLMHGDFTIAL